MAIEVTTAQALHWRDWLVEHMPADIISSEEAKELQQFDKPLIDEFMRIDKSGDCCGPLDFFLWQNARSISPSRINIDVMEYLNTWYGDWEDVLTDVTKDTK